jgi:hypothetical protein
VDWQVIAVTLAVLAAGIFVVRQTYRTWSGKKTDCGGCGCHGAEQTSAQAGALIPAEQLTVRLRGSARR